MSQHPNGSGAEVLVVEDEPTIALDLARELQHFGFEVAGPFARCDRALGWLAQHEPDCAIVDIALPDGSGLAVARELRRRRVPFVFFTSPEHVPQLEGGADWADTPWVGKLTAPVHLVRILEGLRA